MTIAVVGDRVTSWRPPDDRETSWASYVIGDGVRLSRSWVDRDARARDLADEVDRSDADVLVVLVGTNDLTLGAAPDDIELGLTRIAAAAGVDDVLVSSIPPIDHLAQKTADYNVLLSRIAYRHGWSFVDAGASVVRPDCTYRHDLTTDGIRPSAEGARTIGEAIRAVLTSRADLAPTSDR
jgi:lysophospholipase L1-like esterase